MFNNRRAGIALCCVLMLAIIWLCGCAQQDKTASNKAQTGQDASGRSQEREDDERDQNSAPAVGQKNDGTFRLKWSFEFSPDQPTASAAIKAVIKSDGGLPADASYTFSWEVNRRLMENATGDTLSNQYFKKGDIVRLTVKLSTGKIGDDYKSRTVVIAPSTPSIEVSVLSSDPKGPVVMQLSANDPDGGKLTYALEPPFAEGMEINAQTGAILWKIPAGFLGNIKYRVSVINSDGDKFSRTFDIIVSDKPVTVHGE